jgi:hypothetical protein
VTLDIDDTLDVARTPLQLSSFNVLGAIRRLPHDHLLRYLGDEIEALQSFN